VAEESNYTWAGASGREYEYDIYRLPLSAEPGHAGNYVYAKQDAEHRWVPVYIGQGDLALSAGEKHPQAPCIAERGATHFHCHRNGDAEARAAEEQDLLAGNRDALQPLGCNGESDE
jgi:hypothetical protein